MGGGLCFSDRVVAVLGINYCDFIALTGVSGKSNWMSPKN